MTATQTMNFALPLYKAFFDFSQKVEDGRLERKLLELVKVRASQINGCANCLNMHTSDARKAGETEQRLHLLAGWRDAPVYTDRERAALEWTEQVTRLANHHPPAGALEALAEHFDEEERVQLTMEIIVINGWNRLAVGFGLYDPKLGW